MIDVKLHDIGEGMAEGEILQYFVKVGDTVSVDQPLLEVQTDKMIAELPSPSAGTIKEIIIEQGNMASVGTTLLRIEKEVEATYTETNENKNSYHVSSRIGRILAAPNTRRIAREHGVDIELVSGTGSAGRITVDDIYRFINEENSPALKSEEMATITQRETIEQSEADTIPFRGIRKQIARKMTQSVYTIPHVTMLEEVDVTNVLELRQELKEIEMNISIVAFFMKALASALKDFPVFNAKLDEENEVIYLEKNYHFGLATDTADGLIVPVIHHVEKKSLKQLHVEMKEITMRAQAGKLTGHDLKGGTFTISNVGPMGSIGATPIINYPETALIAFHKTKKRPVVIENDEIAIRSIMTMSLAFDHRVADGATAVQFTNRFIQLIENPKLLMLEMT